VEDARVVADVDETPGDRGRALADPLLGGRLVLPAESTRLEVEREQVSRARADVDGAVRDRGRALDRLSRLVRPEDGERRGQGVADGPGEGGVPPEMGPVLSGIRRRRGRERRRDDGGEPDGQDPASRTRSNVAAS
jgi:hypothetical protein